ncbi:hypothetical protein EWM64_g8112 [Hericium alpestre]|uniref:Uncharacterized protein n=1 Tax=Hericium alpestre TaxID=135208 RepID=A0A4Y9ZPG0_9AGAM|nr:hypothetical protein EWM64_g8112 [Hericium alpestre]
MFIILQPRLHLEVPYVVSHVCDLHDKLNMYFIISPLGKHPEPEHCTFRGRAGFHSSIYCDNIPSSIQNGGIEFSSSAVVFKINARIKHEFCFFTKDGDRDHPIQYEQTGSCLWTLLHAGSRPPQAQPRNKRSGAAC